MKTQSFFWCLLLTFSAFSISAQCEWVTGNWGTCEGDCGEEMQTRLVICQCDGQTVADSNCEGNKPATSQPCVLQGEFNWVVGIWSSCSAECGDGVETRTVECQDNMGAVVNECNCLESKPADTQACNLGDCGVGIGVADPTAALHVNGSMRFEDGSEGVNKILVSDGSGNATWKQEDELDIPETPIPVTYLNNYVDYGGVWAPVTYYKHKDRVYLTGLTRSSTGIITLETMFTLPVGYRPSHSHIFFAMHNTSGCRVDVEADGDVSVRACAESANFLSLEGISFRVAPE